MLEQGRSLLAMGCGAVLMKGGHLDDEQSPDWLFTREGEQRFTAPRIMTKTPTALVVLILSAALAALRPRHTNWADTVQEAKSWLSSALACRHAGSWSRYWSGSPLPRPGGEHHYYSCFGYCQPLALTFRDETNAAKNYQSKNSPLYYAPLG